MKKKILIVEDDENLAKALGIRLRAKGYEVMIAVDAIMAVMKAMQDSPDLILLDISMPGGNGLQIAERLKESMKTMEIPFIFLTASKQSDIRDMAMAMGALAFFEKPFEVEELLAVIRTELDNPEVYQPA